MGSRNVFGAVLLLVTCSIYTTNAGDDGNCSDVISFTDPYGSVSSPGYPNTTYDNHLDCVYQITAPEGQVIQLSFWNFSVEFHSTCRFDNVTVYDTCGNGSVLGVFCGHRIPHVVTSSGNDVMVTFQTDHSIVNGGFEFSWGFITPGNNTCTGMREFISPGTIDSPGYPIENYGDHSNCALRIIAPDGMNVRLEFLDFDLESSTTCGFDVLEVHDGTESTDRLLGRYCGSDVPPNITSYGNALHVAFESDYSVTDRGFNLAWDFVEQTGCRGQSQYTSQFGSANSEGYPNFNYRDSSDCGFLITAPEGDVIELTFTDISLENSPTCQNDNVTVYDGTTTSDEVLGVYCGESLPPVTTSTSNNLLVQFVSDSALNLQGFQFIWEILDLSNSTCLGSTEYTNSTGTVSSPGYPFQYYGPQSDCSYRITAPPGEVIQVMFVDFELESAGGCFYDHLSIYDGAGPEAPLLGTYCGYAFPPVTTSTTNNLFIRFESDSTIERRGFSFDWQFLNADFALGCAACGEGRPEELEGEAGSFASAGYNIGREYANNVECAWRIMVPDDMRVSLHFVHFDVEDATNCIWDQLLIYEGYDDSGILLGTFCGSTIPADIVACTNNLYCVFKSDGIITASGFRVEFAAV